MKKEELSITQRIKSYEDACAYLKIDPNDLPVWNSPEGLRSINMIKLERITKALNEGKQIDLNEWNYLPACYLYTKAGFDRLSDEEKNKVAPLTSCSGFGGHANGGSSAGLASLYAHHRVSLTFAAWGFRLCFIKRETCDYAIVQFKDLYDSLL